jgi:hypothetical protein
MPGFFDKIKSGADKAAFEADRLRRQSQAQGALNKVKGDLNTQAAGIGQKVLALYDAGALAQPELLELCQQMDALRQQVAVQEAEVERIKQERPPEAEVPAPAAAPVAAPAPTPAPTAAAKSCPHCGATVTGGGRFCPECGKPVG